VTIVVDSIAGVKAKGEASVEYGTTPIIAEKARLISMAMRRITTMIAKMNVCLIFTNQVRYKIGVAFGDPWVTPGGKAIPFHSSVRVRLTRKGVEKDKVSGALSAVGVTAKTLKNRCAPPLRTTHFMIHFNEGFRDYDDWRDYLADCKDIKAVRGGSKGNSFLVPMPGIPETDWPKIPSKEWTETLRTDEALRGHVRKMIDKAMILEYTPIGKVGSNESIDSNKGS
jgi:RecA/RadA recombinase